MSKRLNLVGQKFGRLTVLNYAYTKNGRAYWECKCDCGNKTFVCTYRLTGGITKSCGCLHSEQVSKRMSTHKLSKTPLYDTFCRMKFRCYNKNNPDYKYYGLKGIKICSEWLEDFKTFYDWSLANGYKKGLTIDRINVNGNYEPSNCRWVSWKVQQNNRSNNHLITYNNQTHTLSEWANLLNMPVSRLVRRLSSLHWSVERAFTTPKQRNQYN